MSASGGCRIIIAEKDRLIRDDLTEFIRISGYETQVVDDTTALRRVLRESQTSLLLIDSGFDPSGEFTIIRECRQSFPSLAIVVMTAEPCMDTVLKLFRLGVNDIFVKPFDVMELSDIIERAIVRFQLEWEMEFWFRHRDRIIGLLKKEGIEFTGEPQAAV